MTFALNKLTSAKSAPAANSPITSFVRRLNGSSVYYFDRQQHVRELSWTGTRWHNNDLTTLVGGAEPAAAGSPLTASFVQGYWLGKTFVQDVPFVYYLNAGGDVELLMAGGSQQWQVTNLMDAAAKSGRRPPSPASNSPLVSPQQFYSESSTPSVFYADEDGHIHVLLQQSNGSWAHQDVTTIARAPAAAPGSRMQALAHMELIYVFYLDSDGFAHLVLSLNKQNSWLHRPISADAIDSGGKQIIVPPAAHGSSVTSYSNRDGIYTGNPSVFYVDADGCIHQFTQRERGWEHVALMRIAPDAPLAQKTSPLVSFSRPGLMSSQSTFLFYVAQDGTLRELHGTDRWEPRNPSEEAGAPPMTSPSLSGFLFKAKWPRIYFIGDDAVIELWSNRDQTRQQVDQMVARFAPVVYLDEHERYQPTTVEAFLESVELHAPGEKTRKSPTVADLPVDDQSQRCWMDFIEDSASSKSGDLANAKCYVHVIDTPDYFDLQYWYFYAYNGPGTLHLTGKLLSRPLDFGDSSTSPLGEHIGDWEMITARVDRRSGNLMAAYFAQHADGVWVKADELVRQGDRIVAYASRDGHASFSRTGKHPMHKGSAKVAGTGLEWELLNRCSNGDRMDTAAQYELVFVDFLDLEPPRWLAYAGRWGKDPNQVVNDTIPKSLKDLEDRYPAIAPLIPALMKALWKSLITGEGPKGPMQKNEWQGKYKAEYKA